MDNLPRQKLQEIIAQYGRATCNDPQRCESLLHDLCPQHKREISLLIDALKEGIGTELLNTSSVLPVEATAPRLVQRLYDHLGMAEEFAFWAVETWAWALGLIAAPLPMQKKSIPAPQTSEVSETSEVLKPVTPGQNFTVDLGKGVKLEMVSIPGGAFLMGSPNNEKDSSDDERPQHKVTIQPFYMGKYPVTQAQWQRIMGNDPSHFKGENRPVEQISWNDAQAFCERLNVLTPPPTPPQQGGVQQTPSPSGRAGVGWIFRLPSEAEWEYACRAGTQTAYYFGDDPGQLGMYAWYAGNSGKQTHSVGQKQPNAFGVYDMHGNVWEWCADAWHENYNGAPTDGSVWEEGGNASYRRLRGGSWGNLPRHCRCAYRFGHDPDLRYDLPGFRVMVAVARTL